MSVAELKNELHTMIVVTEDTTVLEKVRALFLNTPNQDWWDDLSGFQKKLVRNSIDDLDNGRVIPHALVREKINNLLQKNPTHE